MSLDPQIQLLVDNLPNGIALPIGDPIDARNLFRKLTVALRDQQAPAKLAAIEDTVVPGATADQLARIYRPLVDEPSATMLFFHGGGWVVGDLESYDLTARTIAERTGITVLSVEYRLAPEHKYPAGVEDALAIADWVLANTGGLGGDTSRTLVSGDSAGGNFAAIVAQETAGRDLGFSGQALLYPVLDLANDYPSRVEHAGGPVLTSEVSRWFAELYLDEHDDLFAPRISPMHSDRVADVAPAVVATAGFDVLRDEGIEYARRLGDSGVSTTHLHYETLPHGFFGFGPLSAAADAAITEVCTAVQDLARP
ncbi:MAG: alpha/beta hydrolase [Solirubrobacterales bacterium]